jgi:hypothetical protein
MADVIVVAADRITAYLVANGVLVWQKEGRGARLAVSADGQTVYAATESSVAAYSATGSEYWTAPAPAAIGEARGAARLLVRGSTGFIVCKPRPGGVDVLAVALEAQS